MEVKKILGYRVWVKVADGRTYFDGKLSGSVTSYNVGPSYAAKKPKPMMKGVAVEFAVSSAFKSAIGQTVNVQPIFEKAARTLGQIDFDARAVVIKTGKLGVFYDWNGQTPEWKEISEAGAQAVAAEVCRRIRAKLADALVVNNTVSHILSEVEAGQ